MESPQRITATPPPSPTVCLTQRRSIHCQVCYRFLDKQEIVFHTGECRGDSTGRCESGMMRVEEGTLKVMCERCEKKKEKRKELRDEMYERWLKGLDWRPGSK